MRIQLPVCGRGTGLGVAGKIYDPETNKILEDSLPKELREEYKDVLVKS